MSNVKRLLGFAWASPLTLAGLVYVGVFSAFGWYDKIGVFGDAWVWRLNGARAPEWLMKLWTKWGGHTIGNVVVMKGSPKKDTVTLRHEQEHVRQCMALGIFQPILYGLAMLAIKLGCKLSDPYFSNPFEIEARRVAGQTVDIEGFLAKVTAAKNKATEKASIRRAKAKNGQR